MGLWSKEFGEKISKLANPFISYLIINCNVKKFLIIQTAFLGDVILATSVIESLKQYFPNASIDFLLRKGNEGVLENHPHIRHAFLWDRQHAKYGNLYSIFKEIRKNKYDRVINLHRFGSSGIVTAFSGAKEKSGFAKNPFSFLFNQRFKHVIGDGTHEIERNHQLIKSFTCEEPSLPKLYPSEKDKAFSRSFLKPEVFNSYVCFAPASLWRTKQLPVEKWIQLMDRVGAGQVFLLGSKSDISLCNEIDSKSSAPDKVVNLAGKLSLLQTAALMSGAKMNYVNDSAPLHLASATNSPVTVFFCSTVPQFGFGPLSESSIIIETKEKLSCRPCGLHGHKECPQGHYQCGNSINIFDIT